jgi:hypothetical protein
MIGSLSSDLYSFKENVWHLWNHNDVIHAFEQMRLVCMTCCGPLVKVIQRYIEIR